MMSRGFGIFSENIFSTGKVTKVRKMIRVYQPKIFLAPAMAASLACDSEI